MEENPVFFIKFAKKLVLYNKKESKKIKKAQVYIENIGLGNKIGQEIIKFVNSKKVFDIKNNI